MEKGVPIRSLSRGLAVLQAINRAGSLSMMEIARMAGVPYPTAARIIQTLLHEELIEQEPARKRYRATALVQTLAHGYQGHGALIQLAREPIVTLTREIRWPVALSARVGHSMVIRDSTHSLSPLTFNTYYPGYAMPILECAAGLAHLAFSSVEDRNEILSTLRSMGDLNHRHVIDLFHHEGLAERIQHDGVSTRSFNQFTRNPGKTSSMAAPVFENGHVVAAVSLAFFASAMTMATALAKLAEPLRRAAASITTLVADDSASDAPPNAAAGQAIR